VVVTASAAGLLTRFIVVGGGFVVVAAFVLALGFPMSVAVGTSLLVIAINTSALLSRMSHGVHLDWLLIGVFTLAAIVGSLLGGRLATRARPQRLSVAFTMLLVAVAQYTAIRSFLSWCDVGALPDPIPHVPTETSQMLARSVTSLLERSRPHPLRGLLAPAQSADYLCYRAISVRKPSRNHIRSPHPAHRLHSRVLEHR